MNETKEVNDLLSLQLLGILALARLPCFAALSSAGGGGDPLAFRN